MSRCVTQRLLNSGLLASTGSTGDSYDKALPGNLSCNLTCLNPCEHQWVQAKSKKRKTGCDIAEFPSIDNCHKGDTCMI